AHLGGLVIPSAPKTAGSWAIRPPSQPMSTKIVIPSGLKQACRISTTCQQAHMISMTRKNLLTIVLHLEPKASNSKFNSTQSMPGPCNPILAANILTTLQSFAMDITDVDPLPLQINPLGEWLKEKTVFRCSGTSKSKWLGHVLTYFGKSDPPARCVTLMLSLSCLGFGSWWPDAHDIGQEWPPLQTDLCVDPVTENCFADTLAAQIRHQATPEQHKIDYKEGLDDLIKRAMEDYQQMFFAACKCHASVLKWQKMLVEELEILQMEQRKYAM
ncbi:hypothetical protein PAXRUDRAFT_169351, partial [Paxillus rubicundulus Ve08.2h10]